MRWFKNPTFYILALAITVVFGLFSTSSLSALSGSDFIPGRIMDDAVFFNPNTMNPSDVQTFLSSKVSVCDTNGTQIYSGSTTRATYGTSNGYPPPYTCLKDFSQYIPARSPDSYCGGSISEGVKSAAQIIYDVSQACGVNPKILIVLLQKEQGLVSDDWPWTVQYRKAMGYACPDSSACDPSFADFFSQVYYAARQFQRYVKQASEYNFRAGQTNSIQYNPISGCGSSNVFIQNQTTAGLYNYTPYQPNAAALNNLYGTGDGCSAYGNRNFWRMYIDWFGSTLSTVPYAWMYEGHEEFSNAPRTQRFTSVSTVVPDGKIYIRLKARNMGTNTWSQSSLHLGTSRPMDRVSQFADISGGWLSNNRPAQPLESSVPPGQIGTFEFTMQAPSTAGTYNEYFNLLVEGITWLNDLGLFYTVNVNTALSSSANVTILGSGQTLNKGDYKVSPQDSQSVLTLQSDGNLVLYSNFQMVWETGTQGSGADHLVMQGDGNLVLYNQGGQAKWASSWVGAPTSPGAYLTLQPDGNMVLYPTSGSALWANYTLHNPNHLSYVNTTLTPGFGGIARLYPGQSIDTADRRFHLILQTDGNLVLYSPTNGAIWATGTDGKNVSSLVTQSDGNLVLYDTAGRPLWFSGTHGYGKLRLIIQQDGNLVLYNNLNIPIWNTATAGQ